MTGTVADRYRFTGYNRFVDPDGYPAVAMPWGTLNAIDMNTGQYVWKIPLGQYPELAAQGQTRTGSENYGGPIVTAGGLLFIGATLHDKKFRAFDKTTGELVWETTLPFAGTATPITYEVGGTAIRRHCRGRPPRSDRPAASTSRSPCRKRAEAPGPEGVPLRPPSRTRAPGGASSRRGTRQGLLEPHRVYRLCRR